MKRAALPCSAARSWMKPALATIEQILAALRTMRPFFSSASNRSSDRAAQTRGSKPANNSSKAGHLSSTTFQEKPAWKMRRLISDSRRLSGMAAISAGERDLLSASSASSAAMPPLLAAASAMTLSNLPIVRPLPHCPCAVTSRHHTTESNEPMATAKTVSIYGIKACDTMKKARTWLETAGIDYAFHDYKTQGIDAGRLQGWAAK